MVDGVPEQCAAPACSVAVESVGVLSLQATHRDAQIVPEPGMETLRGPAFAGGP